MSAFFKIGWFYYIVFFPQSVKWMNILAMNLYLAPSLAVVYDESDDGNDDKQELIAHCCSLT